MSDSWWTNWQWKTFSPRYFGVTCQSSFYHCSTLIYHRPLVCVIALSGSTLSHPRSLSWNFIPAPALGWLQSNAVSVLNYAAKMLGSGGTLHAFLASVLDGSEWPASLVCRFTDGKEPLSDDTLDGELGEPQSRQGAVGEVKNLARVGNLKIDSPVVRSASSKCSDWVIQALGWLQNAVSVATESSRHLAGCRMQCVRI
jgi:hypothetical protein